VSGGERDSAGIAEHQRLEPVTHCRLSHHRYVNRLTAAFQPDDSCIIVNNRRRAVV
jgi:hypothetical protein